MIDFNMILYDDFETLDAFGPAEVIGRMPELYNLNYCSLHGGIVVSSQQIEVRTYALSTMRCEGVLLIPGGIGARALVDDEDFIEELHAAACKTEHVLTVCTGSALLARTGLLDGKNATSNKRAFGWVSSVNPAVNWIRKARWVTDGRFYTASGVSAGIDMTLGFVGDLHGVEKAQHIADEIEYLWNSDKDADPFSA